MTAALPKGRTAIEAHLSPIFADHPTAAFVALIRTTRRIGNLGILRSDTGMIAPGASEVNPATSSRQTLVAQKAGGQWRIELFQNTPAVLHWDDTGREALSNELNTAFKERGPFPPG